MSLSLLYSPYPDPSYPGEIGVSQRRFWIGPIHNGPWVYTPPGGPGFNDSVYQNYQIPWQLFPGLGYPDITWGIVTNINVSDPNNSYIDMDKDPGEIGFPGYVSGSEIYQNTGFTWTTVLPWDATERARWLYPNPITTDTKIYYNNQTDGFGPGDHDAFYWYVESAISGSVLGEVFPSDPDVIWHQYYSDGQSSVVTEAGEDDNGPWIKVRPWTETGDSQIVVCAGNGMEVQYMSGGGSRYLEIAPHSRPTRTGCIYVSDGPGNRIIQRETPSLVYMSDYADAKISYPTGICNDGTYLYVLNYGNQKLVKYLLGDPATGTADDLVYDSEIAIGTFPNGICTDGTYLYYTANESGGYRAIKRNLDLSLVVRTTITFAYAPRNITVDDNYVYVAFGGSTADTSVTKLDKSTLASLLTSYITQKVSGMYNDGTYMYVTIYDVAI